MDIGRPTNMNEAQVFIGMVQYWRGMWARRFHILAPLTEANIGPKGKKILWNDTPEDSFKELKCVVTSETLFSYPDWNIYFMVHTNEYDKHLCAVISQNNKPIFLFSIRLSNTQHNYTTTENKILVIVECLKQFRGILFVYKINIFI